MSTSTIPLRPRSIDNDSPRPRKSIENDSPRPRKSIDSDAPTTRAVFYFRLASESSAESADDTESIYSIQEQETDFVKDTSDTETKSESEFDIEIEYEIGSLSSSDGDANQNHGIFNSSSDGEDIMMAAATSVVCDSSLMDTGVTDGEDSDNSKQGESSSGLTDFWTCIQCKSQNDNPQYRFCDKCYQDRKTFFPPRPKRHKKAKQKNDKKSASRVTVNTLKSCLSGLSSQDSGVGSSLDSGIGSSQEFGSSGLEQIVVGLSSGFETASTSAREDTKSRKRQISESSLSEELEVKRPKKLKKEEKEESEVAVKEKSEDKARTTQDSDVKGPLPECKEMCIMCNTVPKNSVFLHGRIAHMCCCYKCAMQTWRSLKRCPICNRKVSNVVRVFSN